jgi:DNA-directed RNA polymerase specialized sigma24 family protein
MRQCLEGDTDSYSILVDRYKTMVNNIAYRMLGDGDKAKDIEQESFILHRPGQFRFGRSFHRGSTASHSLSETAP